MLSIKLLCLSIIIAIQFVSIISSPINKHYSMVLVGGGLLDDNEAIWNKIIELGGKNNYLLLIMNYFLKLII
jgi:hypothetical protein